MAAIYRYGFEGGNVPGGVTISGSYEVVSGRSGASSSAIIGTGTSPSYVEMVNKNASNEVHTTFQLKVNSYGDSSEVTLFQFGPTSVTYDPASSNVKLKSNGVELDYLSQPITTGNFIPFYVHSKLDSLSGSISIAMDNISKSFYGDTLQGSTDEYPAQIKLGLGSMVGTQLILDDVAVNDVRSYTNQTGSYGTEDIGKPIFIKAVRVPILETGVKSDWIPVDLYSGATVVNIVNSVVDSYIKALKYNHETNFILSPLNTGSVVSCEGVNVYLRNAKVEEVSQPVYIYGYLNVSGSGSMNKSRTLFIDEALRSGTYSLLEKDMGGKLSVEDINNAVLNLSPKKYINKNFFGIGLGDAVYTGSTMIGGVSSDYEVLDFNNLTIASGAFITTSTRKKGLVIYVRENCFIEGTLSMDGRGVSSSYSSDTTGSIIWRNISSSFIVESASLVVSSSWLEENVYQPYEEGTSSQVGISTYGLTAYTAGDTSGVFGGGGSGGESFQGAAGGLGGTSSIFGGGCGGGGAAADVAGGDAGQYASSVGIGGLYHTIGFGDSFGGDGGNPGGSIYLFVGKNLVLGPTGKISAKGSDGTTGYQHQWQPSTQIGGGGGGGGGHVSIFYGLNYYNLGGTIDVGGGNGGAGIAGGNSGSIGGSGSIQILKVLTSDGDPT
jgi:hypothetical protein